MKGAATASEHMLPVKSLRRLARQSRRKLRSRSGMSIVFALLGFMVAAMVSVVVINAAYANAHRTSSLRESEQAFLTAESAAGIVREAMTGRMGMEVFALSYKTITDSAPATEDGAEGTGELTWFYQADETGGSYGAPSAAGRIRGTMTFTSPELIDSASPVLTEIRKDVWEMAKTVDAGGTPEARVRQMSAAGGERTLTAELTLNMRADYSMEIQVRSSEGEDDDAAAYLMLLTFPAVKKQSADIVPDLVLQDIDGNDLPPKIYKEVVESVSWPAAQMSGVSRRKAARSASDT